MADVVKDVVKGAERFVIRKWRLPASEPLLTQQLELVDTLEILSPAKQDFEEEIFAVNVYEDELPLLKAASNGIEIVRTSDRGLGAYPGADSIEQEASPFREEVTIEEAVEIVREEMSGIPAEVAWLNYPMRYRDTPPRLGPRLDQGREGACTGTQLRNHLDAQPRMTPPNKGPSWYALYKENQQRDEWPGENYSGSSVAASIKTGIAHGFFRSEGVMLKTYDEIVAWKRRFGLVMQGVPWYEGMYTTNSQGVIQVSGQHVGYHAILDFFTGPFGYDWWENSWGTRFGNNGIGYISKEDKLRIMSDNHSRFYGVIQTSTSGS